MKHLENICGLKELPRDKYFINYFISDSDNENIIPQKHIYIISTHSQNNDKISHNCYIGFDVHGKRFVTSDFNGYVVGKDFIFGDNYEADEIFEITEDDYRLLILSEVI